MTALRGTPIEDVLNQVGEAAGVWSRIRREAEAGAKKATRTPIILIGSIAVAGVVLATLALLRR